MLNNIDWLNVVAGAVFGSVLTAATAWCVRMYTNLFDYVERRLEDVGIESCFAPISVGMGYGDVAKGALFITIRNHSGKSLYISRAVYLPDKEKNVPVHVDAARSQKNTKWFELKFELSNGQGYLSREVIIQTNTEARTFVPLSQVVKSESIPVSKRGVLKFEYVLDGKTGIHRANM
jgi:hypothetical protein